MWNQMSFKKIVMKKMGQALKMWEDTTTLIYSQNAKIFFPGDLIWIIKASFIMQGGALQFGSEGLNWMFAPY
jgi:hypothetical protein